VEPFIQTLKNLGPTRLGIIGAVGVGLIGFLIFVSARMSDSGGSGMELLYAELQQADAGAIAKKLDELKVPYQVDPTGTKISVQSDQVGRLRMQMAQAGLPSGGSIGYEIFDRQEGFGATSFIQNMNQLRALEGEMARTIGTLTAIEQARVHLVLPKRELFSRERNTATASVFVKLRQGQQLNQEQVQAIQHMIASSVPNLEPSRVAIIDNRGKLLARGIGQDSEEYLMATAEEKKQAYEQKLTRAIEDLLGRTLGYGKVRAEIHAELDFDRVSSNQELFDSENPVIRSTQTVTEKSANQERDPLEPVTVNNNLPANQGSNESQSTGPITSANTQRSEKTVNYEISRTTRSHVREPGKVSRLSVAVLVDGDYEPGQNGERPKYKPRSPEEMAQIEKLVRSAIGVNDQRGDSIEVINMRFANYEEEFAKPDDTIFGIPKSDLFRLAEMLILGIVAVLIILLVVRPLITKAFERPPEVDEELDNLLAADQSSSVPALEAPAGALSEDLALEAAVADDELEQMIDISRVEGRVRASSLRKVGEIVEKHPEEAVAIIRSWLYQET